MRTILAALALGVILAGGCGQMGPLYMPDEEPPAAGDPAIDVAAEPETD